MNSYNVIVNVFGLEVSRVRVGYTSRIRLSPFEKLLSVTTRDAITSNSSPLFLNAHSMAVSVIVKDSMLRGLKEVSVMVKCQYGDRSIDAMKEIFKNKFLKINFHIFNEKC